MSTGTQIEVVMPQMGVSVSEGTITKWLKQPGEPIGRDEPLLEISTDKVDTEVPSPGEGVVAEILAQEGETVEVGTVIARIAPAGAEIAPAPTAPAEPEPSAPQEPAPVAAAPVEAAPAPAPPAPTPAPPAPAPLAPAATPAPVSTEPAPVAAATGGNGRSFVSPVVARIAAEHGVDPVSVPGTGTGGRVTKKDILAFIESGAAAAPPAAAAPAVEAAPVAPRPPRRPQSPRRSPPSLLRRSPRRLRRPRLCPPPLRARRRPLHRSHPPRLPRASRCCSPASSSSR